MKCCNHEMRNWSYYPSYSILDEQVPHFYCQKCGSHFHKDRWYTKDEWFFYINGVSYEKWQENQMNEILDSPHAHELINHSDPTIN